MKNYINNWAYTLQDELPAGGTELPLPAGALERIVLAEGDTLDLTIAATLDPLAVSDAEIITLTGGPAGAISIEREYPARSWPAFSFVYASLPAEHVNEIQQRIGGLEQRTAALEQGGGSGGGGGITVGDAPTDAPTALGEAILAYDGLLYLGRDTGDIDGWSRFEPLSTEDSSNGSSFTVWDAPTLQRGHWTRAPGYIELTIGPWGSGLDVDADILLEYAGTDPLVVAGYLSGVKLLSNVAITNNGDGTTSLPIGPAQMIRVSRRAASRTVVILIEPLQSQQF